MHGLRCCILLQMKANVMCTHSEYWRYMLIVYSRDYPYTATDIDFQLYQVGNHIAEMNNVNKNNIVDYNKIYLMHV